MNTKISHEIKIFLYILMFSFLKVVTSYAVTVGTCQEFSFSSQLIPAQNWLIRNLNEIYKNNPDLYLKIPIKKKEKLSTLVENSIIVCRKKTNPYCVFDKILAFNLWPDGKISFCAENLEREISLRNIKTEKHLQCFLSELILHELAHGALIRISLSHSFKRDDYVYQVGKSAYDYCLQEFNN